MNADKLKAMLFAYLRGLIAAVGTIIFAVVMAPGYDLNSLLTETGLEALGAAALGAVLKFSYDWFRVANTEFGRGEIPAPDGATVSPGYSLNGPTEVDPPQEPLQLHIDDFIGEGDVAE